MQLYPVCLVSELFQVGVVRRIILVLIMNECTRLTPSNCLIAPKHPRNAAVMEYTRTSCICQAGPSECSRRRVKLIIEY